MNVKPISQVIRAAADEFEHKAKTLRDLASELDATEDPFIATTAAQVCYDLQNVRIDLLVRESIRALMKEHGKTR